MADVGIKNNSGPKHLKLVELRDQHRLIQEGDRRNVTRQGSFLLLTIQ